MPDIRSNWRAGDSLTNAWANRVGQRVNNLTGAVPSSQPKIRNGAMNVAIESLAAPPELITITNDYVSFISPTDVKTSGLYLAGRRYYDHTTKNWEHDTDYQYVVDVRCFVNNPDANVFDKNEGFLLLIGDVFSAYWHEQGTVFVPINPPMMRRGRTSETISPGSKGKVELQRAETPTSTDLMNLGREVYAYLDHMHGGEQVSKDKEVEITYFPDSGRYGITDAECEDV